MVETPIATMAGLREANASIRRDLAASLADRDAARTQLVILLRISRSLGKQIELAPMLEAIVAEVTAALAAERSTLFLVCPDEPGHLVTRVAEGVGVREIRVPIGVGIAGAAAKGRQTLNIADAYQDDRFNPAIDKTTGFRTRAMLTAPIIADDDRLIGVVQVLNKNDGGVFTAEDEAFLEIICGILCISLQRAEMVEAYLRSQIVQKSLDLAQDIQMGLVPKNFSDFSDATRVDMFATMIPALEVGGDLYDFFALDKDRICFVIGDVSGKGIPAALVMAMACTAFRISAMASQGSIAHTMELVNRALFENNPSQMFITAFAGVLDLRTGQIEYADAGHDPPFVRSASGAMRRVDKVGGIALGFLPDLRYCSGTLQLHIGDTLLLHTDGVTEAMDARDQFFGADAIENALATLEAESGSESIVRRLLEDLRLFVGEAQQSDDITLLAVRYLGRDALPLSH